MGGGVSPDVSSFATLPAQGLMTWVVRQLLPTVVRFQDDSERTPLSL
jgi:hypothetical protein